MKKIKRLLAVLLLICLVLSSCAHTDCRVTGSHKDENLDYKCDSCRVSVAVLVDFYALNDLHGKFDDTASNIGIDELSTYLSETVYYDEHSVFLASGDMWQGSSESNLTEGAIITEWMNEMGFVSMTIGNHEYDWGEEAIRENSSLADFPLLAINIYSTATNSRIDYAAPSVMVERGGLKIGIIGAVGNCYSSISGDKTENVYFKVGSELTSLVKAESQRLRSQGADFIVYSIHDGNEESNSGAVQSPDLAPYYDVSLSNGYVDIVFEAHTHKSYVQLDTYGVYHLQGGGDNRGISHAEVKFNTANGTHTVTNAKYVPNSTYSSLADAPIVDELLEKYSETIAKGNRILGFNGYYRNSGYLADLIAKLYTEWGVEEYGDEYDIVLGGGYLKLRSPYYLDAGYVKYSHVQMLFPFDNVLTLCSVSGYDLKANFIYTQNENYHVFYTEYGESIKDSIVDTETYYVIVDSYTSQYRKNNLTVVKQYVEGFYARDLLAEYIEAGNLQYSQ